jgi:MFS-type transporter involved in bile tolerance (Atg22 family)
MARSRVMNMSYVWNNVGFTVSAALSLGALAGLRADDSTAQNNLGYSVAVAVTTGFWVLLAGPWFLWEKRRPGPSLPPGTSYLTFGFRQAWFALGEAWTLRQTFAYLVAFFFLADGVGTLVTLVAIAQTQVVDFSATQNTYFIMVQGACAGIGVFVAFWLQQWLGLRTKTVLQVTNVGCVLLAVWGMAGIWTDKVGYHNVWEFWAINTMLGLALGPQFSYGQAFMAELVPRGREYLFFSLLGIVSKGSSWIGPIVSSAIVDRNGNQWAAFPFVAALIAAPTVAIFFISETKSRAECAEYLAREATKLRKVDAQTDLKLGGSEA